MRKIVFGISGASGQIYAHNMIDLLLKVDAVTEIALVFTENGEKVWNYEQVGEIPVSDKIHVFENDNLFAAPSSGSAMFTDMIVLPCSMGSLAKMASGIADTLITRAADVMLKERRNLILAVRESPLNLIHLDNMTRITHAGGIVFPLSPFFYQHPKEIIEMVQPLNSRILSLLGLSEPHIKWS